MSEGGASEAEARAFAAAVRSLLAWVHAPEGGERNEVAALGVPNRVCPISWRLRPWEPGALSCRDAGVVPVATARARCHAWTGWSGTSRLPRSSESSEP